MATRRPAGHGLAHGHGRLDTPGRVVLVGQRREPERRHQGDALLVDAQLVDAALQSAMYRYEGSINKLSVDEKGITLVAALGYRP